MNYINGQMYCLAIKGKGVIYKCIITPREEDCDIMVWGFFSAYGIEQIVTLLGKVNARFKIDLENVGL